MKKTFFSIALFLITSYLHAQNGTKQFTLEDFTKYYSFYPESVDGIRSMNDGEHYTTFDKGVIRKFSYATGQEVATLADAGTMGLQAFDYQMSADESKILFACNRQSIYRHSFTADFYVYDLAGKSLATVSDKGKQQLATLSPDGKKVAFVRDNNLFIKELATGNEYNITTDGEINKIINGAPDWVYEEEFSFSQAFDWSPDGQRIAYMRFDESAVRNFGMTMFAGRSPQLTNNLLYPEYREWKYPKAGEANSIVSVHVYDIASKKTLTVDVGSENDQYIPRIKWTAAADKLAVLRLNRLQNHLEILIADAATGKTQNIYSEKNKYYVEITDDLLTFSDDGKNFIILSEMDGYTHIYLYDMTGKQVAQVTKGQWDVKKFYGYDSKKQQFYYQAAELSPMRREVYVTDLKAKKRKLSTNDGTNNAEFSTGFKYYINTYSSITTPTLVTLHKNDGKLIRTLQDNADFVQKVSQYQFAKRELINFTTSEGVQLNGWMLKPPTFDASKKYPVLMYQYSGPNSQQVLDEWDLDWHYLVAQDGYIVVCVDGRGTGARGEAFRKITYGQLGKYETIDQIETAKYLAQQPYVDGSRIGIWGWSYGGFMAASCLTKGADYFKLGISVAPVTNWRYYDNIYTERYMGLPKDNAQGYDDNSPINHADKLKGKYLLVHGLGDDNVHVQNSIEFSEALVQANKDFDQMYYTNRNHGIYGGNTRTHLYSKMRKFILENL